jgi:hypothetical protein
MLLMVRLAVPVLVRVTVWGELVVSTFCGPNVRLRLAGERLTEGSGPAANAKTEKNPCPAALGALPIKALSVVGKWEEVSFPTR